MLSLAISIPERFALWALGLAIDLLTPLATLGIQTRLPRLTHERLMERYRLFAIIVLGEVVAVAIRGAGESNRLPLLSGALGLALAFALGWTIFDGPLRGHSAAALAVLLVGLLGSGLDAVALLGIPALLAIGQTMLGFRSFGTGLETEITDSHA